MEEIKSIKEKQRTDIQEFEYEYIKWLKGQKKNRHQKKAERRKERNEILQEKKMSQHKGERLKKDQKLMDIAIQAIEGGAQRD